jgi:hypothetical protein
MKIAIESTSHDQLKNEIGRGLSSLEDRLEYWVIPEGRHGPLNDVTSGQGLPAKYWQYLLKGADHGDRASRKFTKLRSGESVSKAPYGNQAGDDQETR